VGLALLAVPCMLVSANSNLLNLALPALAADLQPSTAQLLWISDIYVFLVAGLLLPLGLLADRYGRRRMLLVGASVFGLASIGAALSWDPVSLVVCRGLIGVGAAMLGPSTISLIRSMFQVAAQRATALGVWTASFALGGILGPLVGGLLIESVSWRAVFLVTPPAMVVLLVAGPILLPEHRAAAKRRVDVVGVVLAMVGLLSATYAVKQLATQGGQLLVAIAGVAGIGLVVGFLRRQARVPDPILDLDLFRTPSFTVPLVGNALAFAMLYGTQLLIGQYLQAVLGMSALEAGLWTIPSAAAYAVGGLLAPGLGFRLGTARLLAAGLAVSALGFGVLGAVSVTTGLFAFVLGSIVYSLGLAPVYQVTTDSTVASLPTDKAGVAGATLETITNLGGALGIALFGSLAGAVYRSGTATTGSGTQTIGDALAEAGRLAPNQAAELAHTAQNAFVDGFRLTAVLGAALLLAVAAATPRLLRRSRPRTRADHAGAEDVGVDVACVAGEDPARVRR